MWWLVGQFLLAGAVALGIVAVTTLIASRRVGEREGIVDARDTTLVVALGSVQPALTDELLSGDAAAFAAVDDAVRANLAQGSIVRVKIWTPDGRIVYSDEERLVGVVHELGADEMESLETGRIDAEVGDLDKPENRYERRYGKLLEVYLPIWTPSGQPLLFETYHEYDTVQAAGSRLWRSFAPISLTGLVVLELFQIPLAWSLARRLARQQREREGLLQAALDASEVERRRIAADLHDGVVQELAGAAYSLAAASRSAADGATAPIDQRATMDEAAGTVRNSIKALRSLLVEIYPPDLEQEGLDSAVSDLLARAANSGVTADLDSSGVTEPIPGPAAGLLYRVAQEAVRNTLNHAAASRLTVRITSSPRLATLEVDDDGRGFVPGADVANGHVGLKGLEGLVSDAGGIMRIRSAPGEGATVRVEVPLQ